MGWQTSIRSTNDSGPLLSKYRLTCEIANSPSSIVHIAVGKEDQKEYCVQFTYRHHVEVLRDRRVDTRDLFRIDPRSISHPNILQYIDLFQTEELHASVTMYCQGGTLEDFVLEPSNNYTNANINQFLGRLAPIFQQMTSACDYLHREKKLVHGNITLTNVMLVDTKRTQAVLGDLGRLCHNEGTEDECTLESLAANPEDVGRYAGTSIYVAPEVIAGRRPSAKSDVYAIGACVYVALDSSGPFSKETQDVSKRDFLSLVEKAVLAGPTRPLLALDSPVQGPVCTFMERTLGLAPADRLTCEQLLSEQWLTDLERRRIDAAEDDALRIIVCSDDGEDPNFELMKVMFATLRRRMPLRMIGSVAGLSPATMRARLCKGTLVELGLESIPVAVGEEKISGRTPRPFEFQAPYLAKESDLYSGSGLQLMRETMLRSPDKTVNVIVTSGPQDVWVCLKTYPDLFSRKVSRVVLRCTVAVENGDVKLNSKGQILPDSGTSDADTEALINVFSRLQELGIQIYVVTRHTADAVKMPSSIFEALGHTKHPVARRLQNVSQYSNQWLWYRCNLDPSDPVRALPKHCDKEWFLNKFCDGDVRGKDRGPDDDINDLVVTFHSLSCVMLMASVTDASCSPFFSPKAVSVQASDGRYTTNYIFGLSKENHGVKDPAMCSDHIKNALLTGFTGTDHVQQHMLIISDDGKDQDDELVKILMSCLEDRQLATCRHYISCFHPAHLRARLAKGTLDALGLKAQVGIGSDMGNFKYKPHELEAEYLADESEVHPNGVELFVQAMENAEDGLFTLVALSGMTDAWNLLRDHSELFRRKIQRVVIMGGVQMEGNNVKINEEGFMVPDSGNNNTFDLEASRNFYRECQRQNIPTTVVSRFAAYAAKMPLGVYDQLAKTGHCVGIRLQKNARSGLEHLWYRANCPEGPEREGMPMRCDKKWYCDTFLGGKGMDRSGSDSIWDLTCTVQAYDPIALMGAVPGIRERYLDPVVIPIRGADGRTCIHEIMGLNTEINGVRDTHALVKFLTEAMMEGMMKTACDRQVTNTVQGGASTTNDSHSAKHVREFALEYAKQAPRMVAKQYALMKHLETFSFEQGWF